jgi:hypothetical protein
MTEFLQTNGARITYDVKGVLREFLDANRAPQASSGAF